MSKRHEDIVISHCEAVRLLDALEDARVELETLDKSSLGFVPDSLEHVVAATIILKEKLGIPILEEEDTDDDVEQETFGFYDDRARGSDYYSEDDDAE